MGAAKRAPRRRVTGAIVAAALAGGVAVGVVAASREPSIEAQRCAAGEAPTVAEAVAAAHGCDDDVVVTGALDPWTALVATPRGTLRQEVTAGAVRTDVNGAWEPVDPRVVVAPGTGVLRVAAPVTPISFSRASRGRAVTFETEAGDVALTVPVSLGAPRVDGTHVVYPLLAATGQPVDGAVLTVEVHADGSGVTPAIELRDREAYEQVRAAAGADGLGFEVVAEDGLSVHPADVGFTVVDGTGATVLAGRAAYQWDSAGAGEPGALEYSGLALADGTARPTSDDEGHEGAVLSPAPGDSRAELHATATERGTVFLAADQAMLEDASTTWPVVIDPPISGIVRNDWTVLRSSFPPLHRTSASEGVGRCRPADDASCTGDFSSRMFWRFTSMSVLKELKDDDVVAAEFSAYGTHSYDCSGAGLQLHLMSGPVSSATTWSNQPTSVASLSTRNPKHRSTCDGAYWVTWDATQAAKSKAGSASEMTLGLRASSESSMTSWRRYQMHTAKLSVEYNRAPATPTGRKTIVGTTDVGCLSGAYIATTTPKLQADSVDPDGQNVILEFDVLKGSTVVWSRTTAAGTGARLVTVPSGTLAANSSYTWRVRAQDTDGRRSGYASQPCSFSIDTTKPAPPVITPVKDTSAYPQIEAVYEDGKERGGIGLTGCFKISSSSDAVLFKYHWKDDGNSLGREATPAGGVAVVCHPAGHPQTTGPGYITVRVYDRANQNAQGTYEYDVATAREDGVWTFDGKTKNVSDQSVQDAGEAGKSGYLRFAVAPSWTTGPHTLFQSREGDFAPVFDGDDEAVTDSPVIDSSRSFVVSAHVRLDGNLTEGQSVLSQDGLRASAWRLRYVATGCKTTTSGSCWSFTMLEDDGGTARSVYSTVEPAKGSWTHLSAAYDSKTKKLGLWVCDIGTPTQPGLGEPVSSFGTAPASMWKAGGVFAVGRALKSGAGSEYWNGVIDNVRIFKGEVVAESKIRRMCQGAEATDFAAGEDALDPTQKEK